MRSGLSCSAVRQATMNARSSRSRSDSKVLAATRSPFGTRTVMGSSVCLLPVSATQACSHKGLATYKQLVLR
jgi:hypothetical protein